MRVLAIKLGIGISNYQNEQALTHTLPHMHTRTPSVTEQLFYIFIIRIDK